MKIQIKSKNMKRIDEFFSTVEEEFSGYFANLSFADGTSTYSHQDGVISYGCVVIKIGGSLGDDSCMTYAETGVVEGFLMAGFQPINNNFTCFQLPISYNKKKGAFSQVQNILQKHGIFITEIKSIKRFSNFSDITLPSE